MALVRHSRRAVVVLTSVGLCVVLLVAVGIAVVLHEAGKPSGPKCTVAGTSYSLIPEQTSNAATIAAVGMTRRLPERAAVIALATALQESKLKNLDYGDADSVGLFQQRHSAGWGTSAQALKNPAYSAGLFYAALAKVPDWQNRPLTDVAQAVQRSAYPQAYAKWEKTARALADALVAGKAATLSCRYSAPDGSYATPANPPVSPATTLATLNSEEPARGTPTGTSGLRITASTTLAGWRYANWLVSNSERLGIASVNYDGTSWRKDNTRWASGSASADHVTVTLSS